MRDNRLHIFGIRHHGPGSARSAFNALYKLSPDIVLVEGPPEADDLISFVGHADLKPPVALAVYNPKNVSNMYFYPYLEYSPEWQAMIYANWAQVPIRFMDLPVAHLNGILQDEKWQHDYFPKKTSAESTPDLDDEAALMRDPLGGLAAAAGYSDGESWWNELVEQRQDHEGLFDGLCEAMAAVREIVPYWMDVDIYREAYMRHIIRETLAEGFERVAIVCGAWHVPVLYEPESHKKADAKLLKKIPSTKIEATWLPWTNERITSSYGYSAGIDAPGWYKHLWRGQGQVDDIIVDWMTTVAMQLRQEKFEVSTAQVIDAVRLSHSLASLRQIPMPGLAEHQEAARAVFCMGNDRPMALIQHKLVIGHEVGAVPLDVPMVPLHKDIEKNMSRLRLKPKSDQEYKVELDLRKSFHQEKSEFLHRIHLLGVPWGEKSTKSGSSGTWSEIWKLKWKVEFIINFLELSIWGTTAYDATTALIVDRINSTKMLSDLTEMVDDVLHANLPGAVQPLTQKMRELAALSNDIQELMTSLTPLVNIFNYGNVRETDTAMVRSVIDTLIPRVCVGFPNACLNLDDVAGAEMYRSLIRFDNAVRLLRDADHIASWDATLGRVLGLSNVHGLIAGKSCRILVDAEVLSAQEAHQFLRLALNTIEDVTQVAAWIEGFLSGSGLILIHDTRLLNILNEWLMSLDEADFLALLPLLRRTFSSFTTPERRQISERIKLDQRDPPQKATHAEPDDAEQTVDIFPILELLLGFKT